MPLILFVFSMFVSSALLFLVEPMLGKMTLPLLGGTPAVWNTCLVFFQTVLLAGYLYAHASAKWLGRRTQIAVHMGLVLLPFAVLPLHVPFGWEPPTQNNPVLWILAMLLVAVGLPFFVLSASTPMLQRWFAQSGDKSAHDPYFLYAASNAGSMVGLLSYPLLLEPALRLSAQAHFWSYGYGLFVIMTVACAGMAWRRGQAVVVASASHAESGGSEQRTTWRERLRWIALAFVPSSLMIGVTTALTTDVPAVPLLWVLPLAVYLLSFVLVFARRQIISGAWLVQRLPLLILVVLFLTPLKLRFPWPGMVLLYLLTLFAVAMLCHGKLAQSRPGISRLTEFYLWISFGGVLGGIFNSLIAPVIFSTLMEFPMVLVFAAFLRPAVGKALTPEDAGRQKRNDLLMPALLGLCMVAGIEGLSHAGLRPGGTLSLLYVLILGSAIVWCLSFGKRPVRFALGLAALLAANSLYAGRFGDVLHTERSFFGILRVTEDPSRTFRSFYHGGTIHGVQSLQAGQSREPLAYYARSGPAGSIMQAMEGKTLYGKAGEIRKANWAVAGLGAGALSCYLQPGESLTYYEIDPAVKRIAADPRYFTFIEQCSPNTQTVLGDARLKLREAPDGSYDLIILDAFSGDMIPMHLLTREALSLYVQKLAPGGMLAFNISNNYLRLAPTLGALAQNAGLVCMVADDASISTAETAAGKTGSLWLVMAHHRGDLGSIQTDDRWVAVQAPVGTKLWTDDYSNLFKIMKFY